MAAAAAAVAAEDPRLQGDPAGLQGPPPECDKRKQDLTGSLYALQEPGRTPRDGQGHGEQGRPSCAERLRSMPIKRTLNAIRPINAIARGLTSSAEAGTAAPPSGSKVRTPRGPDSQP